MPRRSNPLRIIEEFRPDQARCAAALLRLLAWEPKDFASPPPDTAGADGHGEAGETPVTHDQKEVTHGTRTA